MRTDVGLTAVYKGTATIDCRRELLKLFSS